MADVIKTSLRQSYPVFQHLRYFLGMRWRGLLCCLFSSADVIKAWTLRTTGFKNNALNWALRGQMEDREEEEGGWARESESAEESPSPSPKAQRRESKGYLKGGGPDDSGGPCGFEPTICTAGLGVEMWAWGNECISRRKNKRNHWRTGRSEGLEKRKARVMSWWILWNPNQRCALWKPRTGRSEVKILLDGSLP